MNYKLTCYCSACNDPKGTRNVAYNPNDKDKKKGMPTQATAGFTVAVSKSKYKEKLRRWSCCCRPCGKRCNPRNA